MTDPKLRGTESESEDSAAGLPDRVVGLLTVEAIALLIGMAMPITPSKTGSTWSPAELFWPNPSYIAEVAVYFVMTNLMILVLGLGAWAFFKRPLTDSEPE